MAHIAKTVRAVGDLSDPLARRIMDRSIPVTELLVNQVIAQTMLSWLGRKPKPAVTTNGTVRATNLDLMSVLMELKRRHAFVELPRYENRGPFELRAGQQHVSSARRGRITGLISHREHLSLGVRIFDQSVVNTDDLEPSFGDHRTFMVADQAGAWHAGWHGLSWDMTPAEASFFNRKQQLLGGQYQPEDYLHKNRRESVYGRPYLLAKLLWQRLQAEIDWLKQELKRLEEAGVEVPAEIGGNGRPVIASGDYEIVLAPTFTMELSGPAYQGDFAPVSTDEIGLRTALERLSLLQHQLRPHVQFVLRAAEIAFYRFGREFGYTAPWIKGAAWESGVAEGSASFELGEHLTLGYSVGEAEIKVAAPEDPGPLPQTQTQRATAGFFYALRYSIHSMPELPEVETVCIQLRDKVVEKTIDAVEVFHAKIVAHDETIEERLVGKTIAGIDRIGKLMIFRFENESDLFLLAHLKMTGQFFYEDTTGDVTGGGHSMSQFDGTEFPGRHTRVAYHFTDGSHLYFNDMRLFGYTKLATAAELAIARSGYGPEPIDPEFDCEWFQQALKKKKTPIKAALLNQAFVAGLGNIYVDEALFRAGVRPTRRADKVTKAEAAVLCTAAGDVMRESIAVGGTTFQHFKDTGGENGNFTDYLKVFGQQGTPCQTCVALIKKIRCAGRGTHYCPECQS